MNVMIRLYIDDHTKDSNNLTFNDVSLRSDLSILDLQNLYKQSEDNEIYVIIGGEVADSNCRLIEKGINDGSCIKIVIKRKYINCEVICNEDSIKEIIKKHKQILKTRFKQVINESLERGLGSVIDNDCSLEKDLLAYSIASDYRLLRTLLGSTESVSKLLHHCPVLIPAALKMINIIQERLKKVTAQHISVPEQDSRYFSLGEVEQSDDSSDDDEDEPSSSSRSQSVAISRSQLRNAISSAASPSGSNVAHQSRQVSLSQLRSAIQTAIVPHEPMEVDGPPEVSEIDQKVDQLVSMGFSDRHANKEALEASGGDIMTAIEFLLH